MADSSSLSHAPNSEREKFPIYHRVRGERVPKDGWKCARCGTVYWMWVPLCRPCRKEVDPDEDRQGL